MALEVHQPLRGRLFDKLGVQLRRAGHKRHVHAAAVRLLRGRLEQTAFIQEIIQQRGFLQVYLFNGFHAAQRLEPFKAQAGHIDAVGVGGIDHAAVVRLHLPVHQLRAQLAGMAQQILAHNHNGQPRRADVLLRARIHDAELGNVVYLAKDVAAHVRHQRHVSGIRQLDIARAVDGVVGGNVQIIRVRIQLSFPIGHIGIHILAAAGHGAHLNVLARLRGGGVREVAAVDIVGFSVDRQVQRHGGKLLRGAAMQKQDGIRVGNMHQLGQAGDGAVVDFQIGFTSMAHLHHGHARGTTAHQLLLRALQHRERQHRRSRRKIVNAVHNSPSLLHGRASPAHCHNEYGQYYAPKNSEMQEQI